MDIFSVEKNRGHREPEKKRTSQPSAQTFPPPPNKTIHTDGRTGKNMTTQIEVNALAATMTGRFDSAAALKCVRTLVRSATPASLVPRALYSAVDTLSEMRWGSVIAWAASCLLKRWKRQFAEAEVKIVHTPYMKARDLFEEALMREERQASDIFQTPYELAVRLAGTLECDEPVPGAFRAHVRMLHANLANIDSDMRWMLLAGHIEPEAVCKMTSRELLPEKTRKRDKAAADVLMAAAQMVTGLEDTPPGAIVCKCKCNRVATWERQTRSADEPSTVFCQCAGCNRRWRL